MISSIIGVLLIALGCVSLIGAVDILRTGGSTEDLAQGFLVPGSLFIVGGFVIWMGWQARGGRGED
ncbi:MAG: hypothetical protein AUK37_04910 [Rhodobacterales bacterium CG2_30_65_12]|nr:MAG: hypothetical protein AUK37_04910 [Rhodobacterales bacterium CG2_30_65_12]